LRFARASESDDADHQAVVGGKFLVWEKKRHAGKLAGDGGVKGRANFFVRTHTDLRENLARTGRTDAENKRQ